MYNDTNSSFENYPSINGEDTKTIKIILFIILIVFIIFIILILYYYFVYNSENDELNLDLNYGALVHSEKKYKMTSNNKNGKNRISIVKIHNKQCNYGFFGPKCDLQVHDSKYYNVGKFNSTYTSEIIPNNRSLSLDYYKKDGTIDINSCTSICDNNNNCKGVIYDHENNICELITSSVKATGMSELDFDNNKQMYLTKNRRPQFTDKIIAISGSNLQRSYIDRPEQVVNNSNRFSRGKINTNLISMVKNTLYDLDWVPKKIINHGNFVGLYSKNFFTINNWSNNNMIYIDKCNGTYNIPKSLQDCQNIYIMYITLDSYNSNK